MLTAGDGRGVGTAGRRARPGDRRGHRRRRWTRSPPAARRSPTWPPRWPPQREAEWGRKPDARQMDRIMRDITQRTRQGKEEKPLDLAEALHEWQDKARRPTWPRCATSTTRSTRRGPGPAERDQVRDRAGPRHRLAAGPRAPARRRTRRRRRGSRGTPGGSPGAARSAARSAWRRWRGPSRRRSTPTLQVERDIRRGDHAGAGAARPDAAPAGGGAGSGARLRRRLPGPGRARAQRGRSRAGDGRGRRRAPGAAADLDQG